MRQPSIYTLSVRFLSNERPFSTVYDPWPQMIESDERAKEWAAGMQESLHGYECTLLKNGQPMAA
jgi:hypothetical protein